MLDLEAAKAEVRHWLPTYERRWQVPACIVEDEMRAFTPLRELQAGASEPEESLEVFRRTKRRA